MQKVLNYQAYFDFYKTVYIKMLVEVPCRSSSAGHKRRMYFPKKTKLKVMDVSYETCQT